LGGGMGRGRGRRGRWRLFVLLGLRVLEKWRVMCLPLEG
jgi:hypothetical protein